VDGTKMEYMEYVFTFSHCNWKWNFGLRFLEFNLFHALGSARTLTAITRKCVAY